MFVYISIVLINLIFPTSILLVGLSLKKGKAEYPEAEVLAQRKTKDIRRGYRTPSSMSSREAWDYAQTIAPVMLIKYAKILYILEIIISLIIVIFRVEKDYIEWSGYALGITFLILSVVLIDKKIEDRFK